MIVPESRYKTEDVVVCLSSLEFASRYKRRAALFWKWSVGIQCTVL